METRYFAREKIFARQLQSDLSSLRWHRYRARSRHRRTTAEATTSGFCLQAHRTGNGPKLFLHELFETWAPPMFADGQLRNQIGNLEGDIRRRIPAVVPGFLHRLESHGTFFGEAFREFRHFAVQRGARYHLGDQTDTLRIVRRHHFTGERVIQSVFWLEMFSQDCGGFAGRKMAEIDFGQPEARFLRSNGDVAPRGDRQGATETPAGDASDDRLRQGPEHLVAPAPHLLA